MLKLLGRQTSGNVQKVMFCLEEIGLPYERADYGRQFNNTATPEYKAMNPTSKVPTLVDGSTVVWESNTILRYLAALHAPKLTGATSAERTEVERWMDWLLASLNTPYVKVFVDSRNPPDKRSAAWPENAKTLRDELALIEGHMAKRSWFALDRLTLADIAMAPIVKRCLEFPIDRPKMPGLEKWQAVMDGRRAFQVAIGAKS